MRKVIVEKPANITEDITNPNVSSVRIINLKTATPFNIAINSKGDKNIATLYFLCRDREDKLFMLDRNYLIDDDDDLCFIESLPFTEQNDFDFPSVKIVAHTLNGYLDTYISDMEFYVPNGFEKEENPTVYTYATDIKSKENVRINMTADTFACINFVDNYIFDGIDCEHDLALATVAGSKVLDNPAQFFLVDNVEAIVSMASTTEKEEKKGLFKFLSLDDDDEDDNTTIGLVMKVSKFDNVNGKENAYILTTFDTGVSFSKDKFKGKTIQDIQQEFYGESDQYVGTLTTFNTKLHGENDKEYMIIRGKTKDMKVRLFLFNTCEKGILESLIDVY